MMASSIAACNSGDDSKKPDELMYDSTSNPFAKQSELPYHTIPFDKIKVSDFKPAFIEAIKLHNAEVAAIANNTAPATFENTFVAMEKSGVMLNRVDLAFNVLTGANTSDALQKVEEEMAPILAAHNDEIFLNEKLFQRVDTLYRQLTALHLNPEAARLVEVYHQKFIMAGAGLADSGKASLKKLNEEEATLSTRFSNQLLAAAKSAALTVDSKDALSGLSETEINAASQAAQKAGKPNSFQLAIINTTQQPALQSLTNRNTRQQLFEHSWLRAERNDSNDTRKTILRIAEIRIQKAKLLGFPNYAAWKLQDQMAQSPETVNRFLARLVPPSVKKAATEANAIIELIKQEKDTFSLQPWDWDFYSEKVRKAKYDMDEAQVKPYFVMDSVLENGVFFAAHALYGISFKERKDIPVYHDDVRVFEVFDNDGTAIALFYADYFKRDNKQGGAWMSNMVEQSGLFGTRPVIYNVCNFPKPVQGQPALISFDDVTTMFHEFGHALHGIFSSQQYPTLSGTSVARDFVEMPSQFNEHWALDTTVLRHYAKHYQTGEPIPEVLINRIKAAATFNQGYAFTEILAAANLDMQWHELTPEDAAIKDVDAFEKTALQKTGVDISYVPPRYRSSYFLHIWSNGYSAGYYAYTWADMLNHDAFDWFQTHGGLTRENGQRFRDMILSKGNSENLANMYRAFRGKDPDIRYLLKNRGLL
ncbi:MAG: M3 family metallopeptidase [Chitinophagaceae bacterium]|nr:M3 family metallopeptidase [Chitinophagaceae bacterium]